MTFFGSFGTFVTLLETKSVIVLAICAVIALIVAILTVIFAEFFVIFVTGIMGGVEAGMALPFVCGMTKIGWIGYVMSAAIAVIGIVVQTMMQSRKIGKKEKIFSKKIKEQVSMESEVEKARMLLDDGEPEESMEAAGDKEKTDNAEDTDKEETVTEIFDLDDTKPDEDNLDDDEDVVTVEKTDEPEDGFLDEENPTQTVISIYECDKKNTWCRKLKTASCVFYTEICNRNCYLQAGCIILTDQIKKDIRKPGSSFVVI